MADETIRLRDLVHSLASTMLVTTQYLDQAVAELQNIYTTSTDGALAGLTPPRFTLDDMTVDLSFVVDDVRQSTEQPDPPTDPVELTSIQAAKVEELLEALLKKDREQLAAYLEELAEVEALQQKFDREKAQNDAAFLPQVPQLQNSILQVNAQLAVVRQQPFRNIRKAERELTELLEKHKARLSEVEREIARYHPSKRPVMDSSRPRSPEQGEPGYVEMWLEYLAAYHKRKQDYIEGVAAFEDERPLGELSPPYVMPRNLAAALAAIESRSGFPKAKVDGIRADFIKTDRSMAKLAELSAARASGGIRVKVDPESISKAPPGALQSLHLTFRSQSQERVNVEGEGVDIER